MSLSLLPVTLLALSMGLSAAAPPHTLRCEYRTNPQGIDALQPRLSWNMAADGRGQAQTAYQVLVASSAALLAEDQGDLWDSGQVASDASIQIEYTGTAPASFQDCFWKVRVWNQNGEVSPWSEPAHWSMGALAPKDWAGAKWIGLPGGEQLSAEEEEFLKASWIWGQEASPETAAAVGTRYFRMSLAVPEDLLSAVCVFSADNSGTLFVNGEKMGQCSDFRGAVVSDITKRLQPGANTLAVSVSNAGEGPNPAGLLL
ncbi:MAG TPA: rhamnosidase, partial [Candidatus Hydrogenedentes bacterium]|nr:rhamnosidase [Candidatus Hydrogenedentota bacterium]